MGRNKTVGFRPSNAVEDYIERQLKRHPRLSRGAIAKDLCEQGLIHSGQTEERETEIGPSSPHVERGKSIETHHKVNRGDRLLIPCVNTNRWVDKDLDCSGCHLRCSLPQSLKDWFEGLAYYATP